jgi:Glycosyltransferase family 10 (fucosyltransferase) C-term
MSVAMPVKVALLSAVACLVLVSLFFSTVSINYVRMEIKGSTNIGEDQGEILISAGTTNNARAVGPPKGRVFECGYPRTRLLPHLFPDYEPAGTWELSSAHVPTDLMVIGMDGPCPIATPNHRHFNGTILFVNGEPNGNITNSITRDDDDASYYWKNVYQMGPYKSALDRYSMQVYHIGIYLVEFFDVAHWNWMFDPRQKPHNTGKHNALIYVSRNCAKHRQSAAKRLSTVLPIHFGGSCTVSTSNGKRVSLSNSRTSHWENWKAYSDYKYCLTMENTLKEGYITEKILLGFMGGCIPIYWGSLEVLDFFNPNAFIYYNTSNPQPAIDEIRRLQADPAAYEEKLHTEPIFRDATVAMEDIFSLTDMIGNGKLKRQIRKRLGID